LAIDATDPFGGGALPPLGRLREPAAAAARATAVIVTRSERISDRHALERGIRAVVPATVPIFYADHSYVGLRGPAGTFVEPGAPPPRRVGVLTAIGNPRVLLDDLDRAGFSVVARAIYPDHHDFSQPDIDAAVAEAARAGAEAILMTEKDAIRLERRDLSAL